jgi:uncharacterized protein (DUF983 family)
MRNVFYHSFAPAMSKWNDFMNGRCPRCGVGKVFVSRNPYNLSKMITTNKECSNCHLDFIPEIGFYWGATYVAYAITVAFSVVSFGISTLIFGFMNSLNWKYVLINGILLFLFCPLFFRFSRMLWLWVAHD